MLGIEFMAFHLLDRCSTTESHPFMKSHLLDKHGKKIINSRSAWAEERRGEKRRGERRVQEEVLCWLFCFVLVLETKYRISCMIDQAL